MIFKYSEESLEILRTPKPKEASPTRASRKATQKAKEEQQEQGTDPITILPSEEVTISVTKAHFTCLSRQYLSKISKASSLAKTVTLKIGNDVPLLAEYPLPNGGSLGFHLAPKLTDEEFEEYMKNERL